MFGSVQIIDRSKLSTLSFLTLQGSLPDMTATTALYLDLQRIYREQADRDVAAVTTHANAILSSINRTPKSISSGSIKTFCKHARNLR